MTHPIVLALAGPVRRSLARTAAGAVLSVLAASVVLAQQAQQPARPATPRSGAPAAKPAAPAQKPAQAPAAAQNQPQQAQQPQIPQEQLPNLIYSNWKKVCQNEVPQGQKKYCATGKEVSSETRMPIAGVVIIEPEGAAEKILRLTLPLGVVLTQGTRLVTDQQELVTAPYLFCFQQGCLAQAELNADLFGRLKKAKVINVQALNMGGNFITVPFAMADFQKEIEGPGVDAKVFAEELKKDQEKQAKLQEELQRRAEDARKQLAPGQPADQKK